MTEATLTAEALDGDARAALKRLILTLADSKRLLGIRYSDWLLGSPTIETGIAASSMCQDEWGHARLLYAMLKDLGVDRDEVEHDRPDEAYASVDALDRAFPDWAAVVAGMVIVDGAVTVALESFAQGRYGAARSRVPKMLAEEEFHASLGNAWYRRLAASAREGRTLLREATQAMLPTTLAWLGASDRAAATLVEVGVMAAPDALVEAFRGRVGPLVASSGIEIASVEPADAWDATRGRGPGHPDGDALERARGDRNRMLLVE